MHRFSNDRIQGYRQSEIKPKTQPNRENIKEIRKQNPTTEKKQELVGEIKPVCEGHPTSQESPWIRTSIIDEKQKKKKNAGQNLRIESSLPESLQFLPLFFMNW